MIRPVTDFARGRLAGSIAMASLSLAPVVAGAQAWLPEEGSASFSLIYSDNLHKKHYGSDGTEVDVGHTSSEILTIAGSYSPTDRLMIQASIPYVNARYKGEFAHPGDIDDGQWHSTLTDLLVTGHFQVSEGPVAFAPYLGVVIPTHDYETLGHSAPGRGLEEYWVGFYAATSLHEWIARTYVDFRANYAFVEEVANVSHDRTNLALELGYFFNESVSARLFVARQWTDGGVQIPVPPTDPLFPYHDQLAEDEFVNVGGGFSWALNGRMQIFGLYTESIEGQNSHKVDHRMTFGVSYGTAFGRY
jgi:hypothetical protein